MDSFLLVLALAFVLALIVVTSSAWVPPHVFAPASDRAAALAHILELESDVRVVTARWASRGLHASMSRQDVVPPVIDIWDYRAGRNVGFPVDEFWSAEREAA